MPTKLELAREIVALEVDAGTSVDEREALAVSIAKAKKSVIEDRLAALRAPNDEPEPQTTDDAPAHADEVLSDATDLVPAMAPEAPSTMPSPEKWDQLTGMADYFGTANLVPSALRGPGKAADRALILLAGHDLGITPTQAFQKVVVVDGKLSMMAELMAALILRDGHRVWPDPANDDTCATAWGQRWEGSEKGWSEPFCATFTLEDAARAGLCTIKDGKAHARGGQDGKSILAWEKYTPDLLWARSLSRLARRGFPDCLAGISYVPEELGYIDAEPTDELGSGRPTVAGQHEPTMSVADQRSEIARRIAELPEDAVSELREAWKRRNLPKPDLLTPGAIRTAMGLLEEAEQAVADRQAADEAHVADAETECAADGCDVLTTDEYCSEHQPPPDANQGAGDGPASEGDALQRDGADSHDVGRTEPEPAPTVGDVCTGCGEPEHADDPIVVGDDGRKWHATCAPFMGGGS